MKTLFEVDDPEQTDDDTGRLIEWGSEDGEHDVEGTLKCKYREGSGTGTGMGLY
jgi:hypothetical protein